MNYGRLTSCATVVLLVISLTPFATAAPQPTAFTIPADGGALAAEAVLAAPQLGEPPTVESLRAKSDELTRRFKMLDYDPWLRAWALEPGAEAAFRWVRDNVRFESYAGAFRSAKGAYIARAANAADRSLLLAELLRAQGFKTRFVTGQLPAARAEELFERMFEPAAGASPDAVAAAIESPQRQEFTSRVAARARRDYGVLRAALGNGLPTTASPTREDVLRELAPHVWVQASTGGKWVDLDTAFAGAEPGQTFAEAGAPVDALPPALHQRMTIRIVVERLNGKALESEVVLEVTKPVTDLVGRQAAIFHARSNEGAIGPHAAVARSIDPLSGGEAPAPPKDVRVPVLAFDRDLIQGKPVRFDDAAPSAAAGPQFVAEFVEFELTFPGGAKETTRRMLVDRGGAAWRADARRDGKSLRALRRDSRGPIDASTIHNVWFSGGCHDMPAYAKRIKRFVGALEIRPPGAAAPVAATAPAPGPPRRGGGGGGGQGKLNLTTELMLIGMQNFPVVAIGDHEFIPALNDDPSARFYLDSLRILMFSLGVDDGDGKPESPGIVETRIDLRRDKVRGVARSAESAAAVARRKLWFGVLGGALEHEITATRSAVMSGGAPAPIASTSALIDRGDRSVVVLRPGETEAAALKNIPCGPDAALRLSGALARGEVLVVPRDAFAGDNAGSNEGGFWAVSLATGDTRAVWGDDLHAVVERSPLRNPHTPTQQRHIIHDDLSSTTEGGNEYILVTEAVGTGTITVGQFLVGAGIVVAGGVVVALWICS